MGIPIVRLIEKKDNQQIASLIRSVLEEFNAPKIGTAYADKTLDTLFEVYQASRTAYFVVEENNKIVGGAGVAKLEGFGGNVCELQKMYFLPQARGRGLGKQMMEFCVAKAREFKYEQIYLETMENMNLAKKLYSRYGFKKIDGTLGNTGHYSCQTQMLKKL